MKYGMDHFHYRNIYEPVELSKIDVINGVPDNNLLAGASTVALKINLPKSVLSSGEIKMLLRDDETILTEISIEESLFAPVVANHSVGTVKYLLADQEILSFDIVTSESKNIRSLEWCLNRTLAQYLMQ